MADKLLGTQGENEGFPVGFACSRGICTQKTWVITACSSLLAQASLLAHNRP